jgi:hypothetical protein
MFTQRTRIRKYKQYVYIACVKYNNDFLNMVLNREFIILQFWNKIIVCTKNSFLAESFWNGDVSCWGIN